MEFADVQMFGSSMRFFPWGSQAYIIDSEKQLSVSNMYGIIWTVPRQKIEYLCLVMYNSTWTFSRQTDAQSAIRLWNYFHHEHPKLKVQYTGNHISNWSSVRNMSIKIYVILNQIIYLYRLNSSHIGKGSRTMQHLFCFLHIEKYHVQRLRL